MESGATTGGVVALAVLQSKVSEALRMAQAQCLKRSSTICTAHIARKPRNMARPAVGEGCLGAESPRVGRSSSIYWSKEMSREEKKMNPNMMDGHFMKMIKKYGVGKDFAVARAWALIVPTVLLCLVPLANKYYGILDGALARAIFILLVGVASGLFLRNALYQCLGEDRVAFLKDLFPIETIPILSTPFTDNILFQNTRWTLTCWVFSFFVVWLYSFGMVYWANSFSLDFKFLAKYAFHACIFVFFNLGWGMMSFWLLLALDYFMLDE
ncbi:MAG: hypothetical protein Q4A28_01585 [Brachymonas sp.]|nr:hypothetical protein [Brachymonas sp.]